MTPLDGWQNFYVIVGSAAGGLIGLQFVVLTLIASRPLPRMAEAGAAFATPTIVYFGVALLLAALISAPWHDLGAVSAAWALVGLAGIFYTTVVARRMRVQTSYQPVFEDWLFHVLLPLVAHVLLIGSAAMAGAYTTAALFQVGASTLLFLFIGIHNSWDAVTYHVYSNRPEQSDP